jgi:hypothetical protein
MCAQHEPRPIGPGSVGPETGGAKTSARRGCGNLFAVDRAGFEPRRGYGLADDVSQSERWVPDDPG